LPCLPAVVGLGSNTSHKANKFSKLQKSHPVIGNTTMIFPYSIIKLKPEDTHQGDRERERGREKEDNS
jgi:hypothetical protein